MKVTLLLVGKTQEGLMASGIDDYARRIGHYFPFAVRVVPEARTRGPGEREQKERQGERILSCLDGKSFVALLDERGKEMSSVEFASWMERKASTTRDLVFVIGGPYGFSRAVYDRADDMLSLSRMTFPHQLARLMFVEQLYRACAISRNEPYHHE